MNGIPQQEILKLRLELANQFRLIESLRAKIRKELEKK